MLRTFLIAVSAFASLVLAPAAHAGRIAVIDCNIDAYNLTGQDANDFDIKIVGATAADVRRTYLRPTQYFPNVAVTDQTFGGVPGVLIHYSGTTVANGERVHIGYEIFPSGPIGTIDQYWSFDGARLGGPDFRCTLPTSYRDGTIENTGATDVWIQRRTYFQSAPVDLDDDLVRGSVLFGAATLVDTTAVALASAASLPYTFADQGHGAYVMIYDVCSAQACDEASRIQTVFNTVYFTPEPGSLALLALGGLAVLGIRRRAAP